MVDRGSVRVTGPVKEPMTPATVMMVITTAATAEATIMTVASPLDMTRLAPLASGSVLIVFLMAPPIYYRLSISSKPNLGVQRSFRQHLGWV